MPGQPDANARFVATALLRRTFTLQPISRELARLRGRRTKALRELAQQLVAVFGSGTRPREVDVARFLQASATFQSAFAQLFLDRELLPRPRMHPATGAPQTWQVPRLTTLLALGRWLHLDPAELEALRARSRRERSTVLPRHQHYHWQWIPRRGGMPRLIEAPKVRLKAVQRRILDGLLAHVPAHDAAHGFVRGRDCRSFVAPHTGQRCVLRMDVRDFFVSFRRARVLRVFLNIGYPELVAQALADLCTTRTPRAVCSQGLGPPLGVATAELLRSKLTPRHLPQGAPTSPTLANLATFSLDARLRGLAKTFGATYTRYADDLLFSGSAEFARDAARCEVRVAAVLLECGLEAAHRKTKVMRAGASQRAAGLVMNVHPAIPRRDRELLEAILVNCVRRGVAGQNRGGHPDFRAHLRGRIAHVASVHPGLGMRLLGLFEQIVW